MSSIICLLASFRGVDGVRLNVMHCKYSNPAVRIFPRGSKLYRISSRAIIVIKSTIRRVFISQACGSLGKEKSSSLKWWCSWQIPDCSQGKR